MFNDTPPNTIPVNTIGSPTFNVELSAHVKRSVPALVAVTDTDVVIGVNIKLNV